MKFRGIALAVVGVIAASVMMMNVGPTSGSNFLEASDSAFNRFIAKHGKSYATKEEYMFRKALFDKAMDEVTTHNS